MPRHSKEENRSALEAMGFTERLPMARRDRIVLWLADHKRIWRVIAWYRGRQSIRQARAEFDKIEGAENEVKVLRPKTWFAHIIWKNAYIPPKCETDKLRPKVKVMPTEKDK